MKTFNIRQLKIYATNTKRALRTCDPRSRNRLRDKLRAQELALRLAKEARALQRVAA